MKNTSKSKLSSIIAIVLIVVLLLPMAAVYADDNDGRLNPHHAEYYTVYCVNDYLDIYLATGTLLNRVLIGRVLGLSNQGGSMDIGRGMTVTRWAAEITVSGNNGNFAPAAGYKTFRLRQCFDANGRRPDRITPVVSGSDLESLSGSTSTGTSTGTTTTGTSGTSSASTSYAVTPPDRSCVYVVRRGDTVFRIAQRYNTTVYAISALNHLAPNRIFVGQFITIPGCNQVRTAPTTPTTPPTTGQTPPVTGQRTHVLQAGQTLYSVGRAYGVTVSALKRANGITDPTRLPAGMVLIIP